MDIDLAKQIDAVLQTVKSNDNVTFVQQPNSLIFFRTPIAIVRQEVQKTLHQTNQSKK